MHDIFLCMRESIMSINSNIAPRLSSKFKTYTKRSSIIRINYRYYRVYCCLRCVHNVNSCSDFAGVGMRTSPT